jgi:phenylalanyl-tRNA synthetase beta chain
VTEVQGALPVRHPVKLRTSRVYRVLGISLPPEQIAQILSRLDMDFQQQGEEFSVTPPSYRFDIVIEEDLIEEVARVHGYENILPAPILARMSILPRIESQRPLSKLLQGMVVRDYQEVINYAFVEAAWERDLCGNTTPIPLKNPIASQMSVMRSSLLGGLLESLRTNLARKQTRVRLFEVGGCFSTSKAGYAQQERLAGIAYGGAQAEQWGVPSRNVDFYDVKGDVEALFSPLSLTFKALPHTASHPGKSARILLDGNEVGWVGELHPQWQQQYDLPNPLVWFEVDMGALIGVAVPKVTGISRVPLVRRDIAVLADESVLVDTLLTSMRGAKAPFVEDIGLFDVYRGKGVEQGKKSLAFRVLLQDTQKTLTESEIEPSIAMLVDILNKNGAQLRS